MSHCQGCVCELPKKPKASAVPKKITPARVAKLRLIAMAQCGCFLCHWALNPALTFEDHAARMEVSKTLNASTSWPAHRNPAAVLHA